MTQSLVKVMNTEDSCKEFDTIEKAKTFPYELDPFQKHCVCALERGENVLCCAKTGSGKSEVGMYSIAKCLKRGQRVFYTTPIKSLSNQKFHDLKEMYPQTGQVGIMTGDIKFCPDAQIVIMTTEILRNLLYKQGTSTEQLGLTASLSLQGLGAVVFDECHYINDRDRGKIWEETMILLPPKIQLVMLSATLDSPEHFAEWLSELKETPCALIQTQYRVVPLTHSVFMGNQTRVLMDAKEEFYPLAYKEWLAWRLGKEKEADDYKKKVKTARQGGHEGRVEGKTSVASFQHQLNETIALLEQKEQLPALVFVFSRKGCEQLADKVTHQLLDSSDAAVAERIFDFHLRHHKANLETLPQYHHLRRQLIRGIAFHHSGILPVLKEVIEILFGKGLIKLLFATETFAVGINMPTKTVLFTNFYKYDSAKEGLRMLRTDEYIQMAGRAGRRGKDTVGYVYYLPDKEPPTTDEMKMMMKGGKPRLESRMEFGYDFLLKTLNAKNLRWLDLLKKSYWFKQWEQNQTYIKADIENICKQIASTQIEQSIIVELDAKRALEETIRTTQNAKRKEAQRSLDRWKDTHIGPRWVVAETSYKKYITLVEEKKTAEKMLAANQENYLNAIDSKLKFLQDIQFLDVEGGLTTRGIAATEFNEGQPILCTELAFRNTLGELGTEDFITCLSAFITEDKEDQPGIQELQISTAVKDALYTIGEIAAELANKEYKLTGEDNKFWDLSTAWIEPVSLWLRGEPISKICIDWGIFEGNFVRAVLRLANLVDEWVSIATLLEDIPLLEKLKDARGVLVRDIIVPDSLYLHL